jgi:hypothetical protein
MIHPLVKILTVDGFFSANDAVHLANITRSLNFIKNDFGEQVDHFNMVSPDHSLLFSTIIDTDLTVDIDRSGIIRRPEFLIHFEEFDNTNEWVFAVALDQSTFNVYEHKSGSSTALDSYHFNYRNLFEWDLQINYILKPGQGILFRPWLFHSFDNGLIQMFRLIENKELTHDNKI